MDLLRTPTDTDARAADRALLVSTTHPEAEVADQLGQEAYSYGFVCRAFRPLLQRWGPTEEVDRPESRLDFAVRKAHDERRTPLYLAFQPLHRLYLTPRVPAVAFPFWEFPDLPAATLGNNCRSNWVRIADKLALVLTASNFTRDAFARAGVKTPVRVVPVPIEDDYFAVPGWQADRVTVLERPCWGVNPPAPPVAENPWVHAPSQPQNLSTFVRQLYRAYIKPNLPDNLTMGLHYVRRAAETALCLPPPEVLLEYPSTPSLSLSGVVYTSILNPFDPRKNWQDLLSAFVLSLRDCDDATLVIKLVASPKETAAAINGMMGYHERLGVKHRCRIVLLPGYLSDHEMLELTRASTYYVNTARAEGACLPLQSYLAAGRPGIAPTHTALGDYFHDGLGFAVRSHAEPTWWPHDPDRRLTTQWHRLDWQSLHDALRTSYRVARQDPKQYRFLAGRARREMAAYASAEEVWPRLAAALDSVRPGVVETSTDEPSPMIRAAS